MTACGIEGDSYQPLTGEKVARISEASLRVLVITGIQIQPSPSLEVWRKAGARIDPLASQVYTPRALVQKTLDSAAKEVRLCASTEGHDLHLDGLIYLPNSPPTC